MGQRQRAWATGCVPREPESQLPHQATRQASAAEREQLLQAVQALHSLYEVQPGPLGQCSKHHQLLIPKLVRQISVTSYSQVAVLSINGGVVYSLW